MADSAVHYLEFVTNDVAAVRDVYSSVFGWRFEPVAELGNAAVARLPDGSRCGIRAPLNAQEQPVVRAYLRVADVAKAAAEAERRGALVALPPTTIPGQGTIAIVILGGSQQGFWQPVGGGS